MTDNNPLTYILTSVKLDATGRWLASLAAYHFDITYISGRSNVDADILSRLPVRNNEEDDRLLSSESVKANCKVIHTQDNISRV